MIWLLVLLLAAAGLLLAVKPLGLPRAAIALLAATMAAGLTGYALQGSPQLPGAPTPPRAAAPQSAEVLIAARRAMFRDQGDPARYVTLADGFARRGRTTDAAGFLRLATAENPRDAEAWVALGNVLVIHAQSMLTPPAQDAFARAARISPGNPAPAYFTGFALLQMGEAPQARDSWTQALALTAPDAPYRPIIAEQLAELERAILRVEEQRRGAGQAGAPQAQ